MFTLLILLIIAGGFFIFGFYYFNQRAYLLNYQPNDQMFFAHFYLSKNNLENENFLTLLSKFDNYFELDGNLARIIENFDSEIAFSENTQKIIIIKCKDGNACDNLANDVFISKQIIRPKKKILIVMDRKAEINFKKVSFLNKIKIAKEAVFSKYVGKIEANSIWLNEKTGFNLSAMPNTEITLFIEKGELAFKASGFNPEKKDKDAPGYIQYLPKNYYAYFKNSLFGSFIDLANIGINYQKNPDILNEKVEFLGVVNELSSLDYLFVFQPKDQGKLIDFLSSEIKYSFAKTGPVEKSVQLIDGTKEIELIADPSLYVFETKELDNKENYLMLKNDDKQAILYSSGGKVIYSNSENLFLSLNKIKDINLSVNCRNVWPDTLISKNFLLQYNMDFINNIFVFEDEKEVTGCVD